MSLFILLSNIVIEIEIYLFHSCHLNYPSIITTIGTITCRLYSEMSDYAANTLLSSPRVGGNSYAISDTIEIFHNRFNWFDAETI
jgi:hypothetical protein